MRGMFFNGESPIMTGTWYNPENGDSFTVRDTFFEDDQMVIQTMDGRMLNYNYIQNYVQSDGPIPEIDKKPKNEELPAEVANILASDDETGILPEDLALINGLGNMHMSSPAPQTSVNNMVYNPLPVNTNISIIEKALSKRSLPDIQVTIDWKDFPKQEINMLMDLMDIRKEEIIDWYVSQLDVAAIMECLKQTVNDYSMEQISGDKPESHNTPAMEDKPTPEKKLGGPKARAAGRPRKKS